MVSDSVSNLVHQEKLGVAMATTLFIVALVLFVIGVSMIGYDMISTRKRREHRAGKL